MMGFIAEWETKLGVKIVCSQVGRAEAIASTASILNIPTSLLEQPSCMGLV
jgi:hypothetical protein